VAASIYNPPMKCPHCLVEFHNQPVPIWIGADADGHWALVRNHCPACKRMCFVLQNASHVSQNPPGGQPGVFAGVSGGIRRESLVWPKGSSRPPCPVEVPRQFASDYSDACLVLPDSAKAAAALGRRCLQNLLRDFVGAKPGNLADEIQAVIDSGNLPSDLTESIDAIRNVGNFAAHPMKSQHSGEILDVEPGEAEWTLDVLEDLFDFYFVRPEQRKKKREALNLKLKEAGKPEMK
jgi:hypothetical protein